MIVFPAVLALILFIFRVPVAISMIISTLVYFGFFNDTLPLEFVVQRMISANESFTLLAVPFFVTIGVVMNYSGISKRLMHFCNLLTGHMIGGLGQVNVLLSTLLGGISGSASADAAMQCKILVPEMEKLGYDRSFATVVTASSSLISPIIPPGVSLILYAILTNSSVGKMFLGGYIPGILLCVSMMITVHIISKKKNYRSARDKRAGFREIMISLKESIWALILPIFIIVSLRFGIVTPTEAGAIIIALCLLIGFFIYKELKITDLPKMLLESVVSTSSIMFLIIGANVFGYYLSWERIPQNLTALILNATSNKIVLLMLINCFLLFMGMFLEGTALLIIATPLLFPAVTAMGIDPVHFGLMMIINLAIGGITPPFGSIMYLTCSITKTPIIDFIRAVWPFIIAMLIILIIVTYCPSLVMFLPNLI